MHVPGMKSIVSSYRAEAKLVQHSALQSQHRDWDRVAGGGMPIPYFSYFHNEEAGVHFLTGKLEGGTRDVSL